MEMSRILAGAAVSLALMGGVYGCFTSHRVESTHEIKPIHITIDLNVRIQNDLRDKFEQQDKIAKKISDEQAAEELRRYLESE